MSCASGGVRGISCTIVHQACPVRLAGAVWAVTCTDAWWTHASPRTCLGGAITLSSLCNTVFGFFCYFLGIRKNIVSPICFAKWAHSTVGISQTKTFTRNAFLMILFGEQPALRKAVQIRKSFVSADVRRTRVKRHANFLNGASAAVAGDDTDEKPRQL